MGNVKQQSFSDQFWNGLTLSKRSKCSLYTSAAVFGLFALAAYSINRKN